MQQEVTRRGAAVPIDPREYPERLLSENEAAEILGVVPGTMANWRGRGIGPEYIRLGTRTIRYTREAIEAFAKTDLAEREPTDELSDAEIVKHIARLANRLARRQRQAARLMRARTLGAVARPGAADRDLGKIDAAQDIKSAIVGQAALAGSMEAQHERNLEILASVFGDDPELGPALRILTGDLDQARSPSYQTSPTKSRRHTKAEMTDIRAGLHAIIEAEHPMSVRQVFYQAVVAGLIEKVEGEYQNTVARLLLDMRRAGEIPYSWVADNTRWMRKPTSYVGLAAFIDRHQGTYRRDLWSEADVYTEIWLEKEALAGVVMDVTAEYDVPLMVSRGFASESYLYSAADVITDQLFAGKDQANIYYFGDADPSGLHISNSIEKGLRRLCDSLWNGFEQDMLIFERVAVTEDQIEYWKLPSRPTKTKGNNHAKGWPDGRPSVELDAIPPGELRNLVRFCIEQHVDAAHLDRLRAVEEEERQQLRIFGQQVAAGSAP